MASGELIRSQGEAPGQDTEAQGPQVRGEALQGNVGAGIVGEGTGRGTGPPRKRKKEDEQRRKQSRERKGKWGSRDPTKKSGELQEVRRPRVRKVPGLGEKKRRPSPCQHLGHT